MEQFISELVQALSYCDVDRLAALCAPEYEGVDVNSAEHQHGPDGMRQNMLRYLSAFPDLRLAAEEPVCQGARIVLPWTARGTHLGPLLHIPATGRSVSVRGVSLFTVRDGKITHGLHVWDVAGLLRVLGLLPDLPEVSASR